MVHWATVGTPGADPSVERASKGHPRPTRVPVSRDEHSWQWARFRTDGRQQDGAPRCTARHCSGSGSAPATRGRQSRCFAPPAAFRAAARCLPRCPPSSSEDMAAHVGASRTPQEVMEHYVSMYIHGNLGKACIPDTIPNRVTDHTCPSGGPLSPSLTTPLPPLDISVAEQQQLGYMPLRDDYEIEYDQDAETLISGLSVNYDDDDVEIELKRAHVDMYVRKLKERQRRKNIARDYNLVPAFLGKERKEKERAPKRKITKEEKELRLKLRPLYQFMSCKEFDDLFENMHKEKMLRAKIRELQRYRRNGITKMEESAEYEAARHKRERRKENKNMAGSKRGKEDGKDGEFAAIENLPGFELLSDREKVLCSSLNLSPARYVTVKTIIIKDHLQKRQGVPSKSRLPSYLDKVLKKRILNFLTESGWIARDAS
ncbi:PREDICTED: transcriptional adapter 2-beta [Dipodomys ordii]|uniref:Transcriptional adapter 2-beta n=1 Tax=Dipodomys ordii TaxID=10020 RepID=A0A1S3FS06_DIPOR|nr:PREDICTED: transcriptional adapter 2-beta [Dipodomys ordii]